MNIEKFKELMKELQDELSAHGISIWYSKIQELRLRFKEAKISNPFLGLSWVEFVKHLL